MAAKMLGVRLDDKLLKRLERYRDSLEAPRGARLTTSDAVRTLLLDALDRVDAERRKK